MFNFTQKCKLLKANSKEWNKTQFGNIFRQIRLVDQQLLEVQSKLLLLQDDVSLQNRQNILLTKRSKLMEYNLQY